MRLNQSASSFPRVSLPLWGTLILMGAYVTVCYSQDGHSHSQPRAFDHGPVIHVHKRVIDLGDMRQHEHVSGSFVIENHGDENLIIKQISTPCGCTSITLDEDQKIIPPEGKQEIAVSFSSETRRGRQRKTVSIFTNDPDVPIEELTIKARVLMGFRVEPAPLVAMRAVHRGDALAPLEMFPTDEGATLEDLKVELQPGLLEYALESIVNEAGVAGVRMTMSVADEIELGEIDTQMLLRGMIDGKEEVIPVRLKGKVVGPIEVRPPRIESTHPTPRGRTFAPITLRPTDGRTFEVTDISGLYVEGTHRPGKKPGDVEIILKLTDYVPDGPFAELVTVDTRPSNLSVEIPVFVNVRPRFRVEPNPLFLDGDAPNSAWRVRLQSDLVSALEIRGALCDNPRFGIKIVEPSRKSTRVRFVEVRWVSKDEEFDLETISATLTIITNVPGAKTIDVSIMYLPPD